MKRAGFSLIELMVAVTILGIIVSIAAPRFALALETAKVDICAAQLRSIWIAQRMYWLEENVYAETLEDLHQLALIDGQLLVLEAPFTFSLIVADTDSFRAAATRVDGNWGGVLTIDQEGELLGQVEDQEGRRVRPVP